MNWHALVEHLARALGVWRVRGRALQLEQLPFVMSGVKRIFMWTKNSGVLDPERELDPADTLVMLLAYARGLRLDVGPCQACADRGGGWEWRYATNTNDVEDGERSGWARERVAGRRSKHFFSDQLVIRLSCGLVVSQVRPCPECSEPGPEVGCEACAGGIETAEVDADDWPDGEGWSVCPGNGDTLRGRQVWERHHPACKGTGRVPGPPQPTGRDIREPWQWVLDALPRTADERTQRFIEALDSDEDEDSGTQGDLGDLAVREAAAVLADQLQARGDALGTVLTAWLRGECSGCGGAGYYPERDPFDGHIEDVTCPDCRGLGSVLGAPPVAVESLVEIECGRRGSARALQQLMTRGYL